MFLTLFLLIAFLKFDLLKLVSFDELDLFDNESGDDGSGSWSAGTCDFPFCSDQSVGSVGEYVDSGSAVGSGVFFPTGIE